MIIFILQISNPKMAEIKLFVVIKDDNNNNY